MEYWSVVTPDPAHRFSAPPLAREPDAATILARAGSEGEWLVPVEMVLKCSSSAYVDLIRARHAKGEVVGGTARVICKANRFFATVYFRERTDLFLALDCWKMGEAA